VKDRISELKDKIEIFKGKTEELLVKQHNTVKGIYNNSSTPLNDQI
jgi:hypothetical protein